MTTPRSVTESVPESVRARESVTIAHIVQRDRVRASLIAVPDVSTSRRTTRTPALLYPRA